MWFYSGMCFSLFTRRVFYYQIILELGLLYSRFSHLSTLLYQLQVKLCSVKMNMNINSGKQVDRVDRFSAESSRSTESTKVESIDRVDRFQGLSNTIQQILQKNNELVVRLQCTVDHCCEAFVNSPYYGR